MEENKIKNLIDKVDTKALIARPLTDWRPILAEECGCYVFKENYVCKRFDQINYKFCNKDEAKEILVDNLYALLRYKYFPALTEEIDSRINEIVKSFTTNLKTTLKRVSLDKDSDANIVSFLPDGCVAFRNGVFDFIHNQWLFKYDIIKLDKLSNTIYNYDPKWIIQWYFDYDFESLDVDILHTDLSDFIEIMKEITKVNKNYCFELMYNMSHDIFHRFSLDRFNHLCEILGYTCLQSFSQHFVLLIGSGQNGKNSLFDGCFTYKMVPKPASNDMDSIENDQFITGALENKSHNIFLETEQKTHVESKMIKALTGSLDQTIQPKGINKYSGVINCKFIFAGNDQDNIKFADTSSGFKRRINMFETYYKWDSEKKFMKKGDYYDTTFSEDLRELKNDNINVTSFIYFAMFGLKSGTKNFKSSFRFTSNDWNDKYADINNDLKEQVDNVSIDTIVSFVRNSSKNYEEAKALFFDMNKNRLYMSPLLKELGYNDYDDMIDLLRDPSQASAFFADNDVYISIRVLQSIVRYLDSPVSFSREIKRIYRVDSFTPLYNNKPYVKCNFINGKLHILP